MKSAKSAVERSVSWYKRKDGAEGSVIFIVSPKKRRDIIELKNNVAAKTSFEIR